MSKVKEIYEESFTSDVCPYFWKNLQPSVDGIEQIKCDKIYDGILNKVSLN